MRGYLGSCGETREETASRIHGWATLLMGLCVAVEVAAGLVHVVMGVWHWTSTRTHAERARERRER